MGGAHTTVPTRSSRACVNDRGRGEPLVAHLRRAVGVQDDWTEGVHGPRRQSCNNSSNQRRQAAMCFCNLALPPNWYWRIRIGARQARPTSLRGNFLPRRPKSQQASSGLVLASVRRPRCHRGSRASRTSCRGSSRSSTPARPSQSRGRSRGRRKLAKRIGRVSRRACRLGQDIAFKEVALGDAQDRELVHEGGDAIEKFGTTWPAPKDWP